MSTGAGARKPMVRVGPVGWLLLAGGVLVMSLAIYIPLSEGPLMPAVVVVSSPTTTTLVTRTEALVSTRVAPVSVSEASALTLWCTHTPLESLASKHECHLTWVKWHTRLKHQ